ncbi:uncharacterized protein LOC110034779 [Phalaenopsis equestris]|uniref:uncharacterized protein LOC110034779 n=1 Tax=Phalaenopsis equestris TaxID=78828 RepID=UPI0009E6561C|nr:uncharacterized protein LOC110034779 [Phalaenopsis equestris]
MPSISPQTTSIPSVDVEWPPPNPSSLFISQASANDKQKQNSGRPFDGSFDDIDPFANWPPKPNGSSINNLSSSNKPYNNFIGSKPNQESGNVKDSLSWGSNKKANLDIGSIFVSANSIGHTAPKLAPPPLTAVGRGRGRSQVSLSSHTKASSEQQPILDLL